MDTHMLTYIDTGSAHVDMTQVTLVQQVASEEYQVSARYPADTQYCWPALEVQLLVRHMKSGHRIVNQTILHLVKYLETSTRTQHVPLLFKASVIIRH